MRRSHLASSLLTLVLLAAAGAEPASAAPVTLSMGGTLTYVDMNGNAPPAALPAIAEGAAWSLAFTFDGDTADSFPGDPTFGLYLSGEFITSYVLTIGAGTVSYGLGGTETHIGTGQVSTMPSFGYVASTQDWGFGLQSSDPAALASDALPSAWPGLSVFDVDRTFSMNYGFRYGFTAFTVGAIEWLGAPSTDVPEPATMGLSLLAALALAGRRSRRA